MTHFMMYYTNISVNLLFLSKYKSQKIYIQWKKRILHIYQQLNITFYPQQTIIISL